MGVKERNEGISGHGKSLRRILKTKVPCPRCHAETGEKKTTEDTVKKGGGGPYSQFKEKSPRGEGEAWKGEKAWGPGVGGDGLKKKKTKIPTGGGAKYSHDKKEGDKQKEKSLGKAGLNPDSKKLKRSVLRKGGQETRRAEKPRTGSPGSSSEGKHTGLRRFRRA